MSPYDPGIRLYVDAPLAAGAAVALGREQAHYLRNVMRLAAGDAVLLFNGRDGEWRAAVESLDKRGGALAVADRTRPQKPAPDLWLLFAPIKRGRIDYLAQKASELGAAALWPVMTDYTNVARVNTDRLRANAVEAAEQCARLDAPEVFEPAPLRTVLGGWSADRRLLLCDESRTGVSLLETLQGFAGGGGGGGDPDPRPDPGPWAVLVGPEGGFSPDELALLHGCGHVVSVGLGDRLLRADTAAVAALACWQAVLGDWRGDG